VSGWSAWPAQGHLALCHTQLRAAAHSHTRQALSEKREEHIPPGVQSLSLHALALGAPPQVQGAR
jgi:hypothetical protein